MINDHINYYFLKKFLFSLNHFFLIKIKIHGKSYRLEKHANNSIQFRFGHSYPTFVKLTDVKQIQFNKYKIFFKVINFLKKKFTLKKILNIRPWNQYTQRGIRFNKQLIYKKKGKKSTFN
jgi:ribosomal protein L6P/L9E